MNVRRIPHALILVAALLLVALPTAGAQFEPIGPEPIPQERVTGGMNIDNGEFPYLVFVLIDDNGQLFACGGSLIAPEWVLTAAHCVDDGTVPQDVLLVTGTRSLNNPQDVIGATEIVVPGGAVNDIAMVKLSRPADLNDPNTELVRYSTNNNRPVVGSTATVVGWGDTDGSPSGVDFPAIAQKADITIEPCDNNIGFVPGTFEFENDEENACGWGAAGGRDSCGGDSGGPLVQQIGGEDVVVATVQLGPADGSCGQQAYGVYQRVGRHHEWIQSVMAADAGATCDGLPVTIDMNVNGGFGIGTPGDDVILGTPAADEIDGKGGDDVICGEGGGDTIEGGKGSDTIYGGPGGDTIDGSGGKDNLYGEAGDDTLRGGGGRDYLSGKDGSDTLLGGGGNDVLNGGAQSDVLKGGTGDDRVNGNDAVDELFGGGDDDTMTGGKGDDIMKGEGGDDDLVGGKGDDTMSGGADVDVCDGRGGNDSAAGCETVLGVP